MNSISSLISRRSFLFSFKSFSSVSSSNSDYSVNLKEVLAKKIPEHNKKVDEFRKKHGSTVIQQVTVDMIYKGMRTMKGMVTETSVLDPDEGIRFRGYSIPECREKLPKAPNGNEPLPEAIWWLLCTGDIPDAKQVNAISKEWAARADLPDHVVQLLDTFPSILHPMAQFSAAIAALNTESKFNLAYSKGIHKSTYWEYTYEDAMNLLAKLPTIASIIYKNLYRECTPVAVIDSKKDWAANFAAMLGYNDPLFVELLRLFLVIHSDHEGGNVSAHTSHLVGSALSDAFLSFSAAMCGLAGPLHGLANQEVLIFLTKLHQELGDNYTENDLKKWILKHIEDGKTIPGYGHAVLRKTDPRYTCQREFALKHLPKDPMFKIVSDVYKIVPGILLEQGKTKNPWPNVDAHSGILLRYFGLTEMNYYTVLFGVSRALGCLSQLIWARGMGLPIERPKSHSTEGLINLVKAAAKQ